MMHLVLKSRDTDLVLDLRGGGICANCYPINQYDYRTIFRSNVIFFKIRGITATIAIIIPISYLFQVT
jgi:hypothetical protein